MVEDVSKCGILNVKQQHTHRTHTHTYTHKWQMETLILGRIRDEGIEKEGWKKWNDNTKN